METTANTKPAGNEPGFKEIIYSGIGLFKFLLKRWWVIGLAGIIGGCLGIWYAAKQKAKYESRLSFFLEDSGGGLSGALSLAAEFGLNIGSSNKSVFSGDNITTLFLSRTIVEQLLLSPDTTNGKVATFADRYMQINDLQKTFTNHPRLGTVRFPLGLVREKFSYAQDSILYTFYKKITETDLEIGRPDRKLSMYEVKMTTPEERFSKVFTERLVKTACDFYTELRTKKSKANLDILEAEANRMRGSAKSAIQSKAAIADINLNPALQHQGALIQTRQLDASAYGAAYGELFKNLEIARYQYMLDVPLVQIIDAPRYPLNKIKPGKLATGIKGGILFVFLAVVLLLITRYINTLRKEMNGPQPQAAPVK